jgi:hypothetical protein
VTTGVAALDSALLGLVVTELRGFPKRAGGVLPGARSSILKLTGSAIVRRLAELLLKSAGYCGMPYPLTTEGKVPEDRIGRAIAR